MIPPLLCNSLDLMENVTRHDVPLRSVFRYDQPPSFFYGQRKLITSVGESCFPLESAGATAGSPLGTGMHQTDLQHLQSPTPSLVSRNSVKSVGSRARITSPCSAHKSPGTSNACGTTPSFSSSFPQQKRRKEVKYFCPATYLFAEAGEVNRAQLSRPLLRCSRALSRNWLQNPANTLPNGNNT